MLAAQVERQFGQRIAVHGMLEGRLICAVDSDTQSAVRLEMPAGRVNRKSKERRFAEAFGQAAVHIFGYTGMPDSAQPLPGRIAAFGSMGCAHHAVFDVVRASV